MVRLNSVGGAHAPILVSNQYFSALAVFHSPGGMLSTIHTRALASAARSASCHRRLSPIAHASTSFRDGGDGASPTPLNNVECHHSPPPCLRPKKMSTLLASGNSLFFSLPSFPGIGLSNRIARRTNFTYAGPRKLSDILKPELLGDKSSSEIVSARACGLRH